jgi:tetratricopeptide (TPR) repeat protein
MRLGLVSALLLLATAAGAADVSVRALLDPQQVQVGEPAELSIEIEGAQNVSAPDISAPQGLTLRYVGPSTQVSLEDGRMNASLTHRYSVIPNSTGTFTIGPIGIDVGGKRYDTGSVTLTVKGSAAGPAAQPGADQLRLVLSAPKSQVYLHEQLPVTLVLSVGNVRVSDLQFPTIPGDGFSLEKLGEPIRRREQTPSGVVQILEFHTTLVPLRSGTLPVGPATMGMNLLVRGRQRDPFFGGFSETPRPTQVLSEPLQLTILPLPDEGRPADFSGAVGHFDYDVVAAPLALNAGDPVTVTSTIRGRGTLESVTPPAFTAASGLRVYPVQPLGAPEAGLRRFEQVVIPQQPGTVTLPALGFSYFDPDARAYRTIGRPPFVLAVRPSAEPAATPPVASTPAQPRPESLGHDLVFIKDDPGQFRPVGARLCRSPIFWATQALPLLAWGAVVFYDRRRRRLVGDTRYARYTRAGRAARAAITSARDALHAGERALFYDRVARAVHDYLSAKLDLPPGSVDAVGAHFDASGLPPQVAHDLEEFFATCERARFAPSGDGASDMQHTLARAEAIVRTLERGRSRSTASVWAALVLAAGLATVVLAGESPNAVFFRANGLYGQERYAEAAAEYEQVLAAGNESGHLYFNLGNAYMKANDIGHAILNYERALRLIPRDADLHANLTFARSLTGQDDRTPIYARLLFPLAGSLGADELWCAASVAWIVFMLLLIAGRLAPGWQRATRGGAIAAGIALAIIFASASYRLATIDLPTYAVVVSKEDATVRFEPSATGTAHFQSKPGSVLRLLGGREDWAQVSRGDGRRGWIERALLATL